MDRFQPSNRRSEDSWFSVGTLDVTTTVLITGLAVASLIVRAATPALHDLIYLNGSKVVRGQVWRVVTWPIANEISLWTVISIALFYVFGRELERQVGRIRFLWFVTILTMIPGMWLCGPR